METIECELSQFLDNRVYNYYLPIPKAFGQQFIEENNRRIICTFTSKGISIQTSLMPYPEGYFILMNQKLMARLNLKLGDPVHMKIAKDESEFGMSVPEELSITLEQDSEARNYFDLLTDGKKRSLIYIVSQVKNTDRRLSKSLAIADHLREMKGKLDFKLLNQKIKTYNENGRLRL